MASTLKINVDREITQNNLKKIKIKNIMILTLEDEVHTVLFKIIQPPNAVKGFREFSVHL